MQNLTDYNLGCSVNIDDEETLSLLKHLYRGGEIGHIQIQIVSLPRPTFKARLATIEATAIPTVIHAPHHSHGVNPCAPAAYDDRALPEIEEDIEEAMARTYEAADTLGAEVIVLHAGRYPPGERAAAEDEFPNFLDRYSDPRLALENLPAVYADYPLLGNTARDLKALAGEEITQFCLDFPHLACTTNYQGSSFREELEEFESLNVTLHHLSNIRQGSTVDEHLDLDHPDSGLDFEAVYSRLKTHHRVPTTLEYKDDLPAIYSRQVQAFAKLWRDW